MRIATLVVAALLATVVVASAQSPYIAVYFDPYHTQETKDCPGLVHDTWYVAAVNFNVFITGTEFAIEYPPAVVAVRSAWHQPGGSQDRRHAHRRLDDVGASADGIWRV